MGRKLKLSALVLCLAMLTPMLLTALPSMIPEIEETSLVSVIPSVEVARAQADEWWNLDWSYRVKITIQNNVHYELTNYQVKVVVNTQYLCSLGKMQDDADDVRFTDSEGRTLYYWIETARNLIPSSSSTVFWVRVPSIPAGGETYIYMYYGNPTASDVSSGSNTFEAYDNFEIGEITDRWDLVKNSWQITDNEASAPLIYDAYDTHNFKNASVSGVNNATMLYSDFSGINYTVRTLLSFVGEPTFNASIVGRFNYVTLPPPTLTYKSYIVSLSEDTDTKHLIIAKNDSGTILSLAGYDISGVFDPSNNTRYWLEAKFITKANGDVMIFAKAWRYGSTEPTDYQVSYTDTSSPITSGMAGVQGSRDDGDKNFFDLFFVRKAVGNEPTVSLSLAEEETAPFFRICDGYPTPQYLGPGGSNIGNPGHWKITFKIENVHPTEYIHEIQVYWTYSESIIHKEGGALVNPQGTQEEITDGVYGYKFIPLNHIGPGATAEFWIQLEIVSTLHAKYDLTVKCIIGGMEHEEETWILVDAHPPATPDTPTATSYPGVIQVSWPAVVETDPNESPIVKYRIYRNDSWVGTPYETIGYAEVSSTTTTFNDYWGTEGETYKYQIAAVDAGGNEGSHSSWSNPATFITERPIISYSIQLSPGWNLISIPVVLEEAKNVTSMLLGQPYDTSTDPIAGPSGLYWADTGEALTWNEIQDNVEVVYAYYHNSSHPHPTTGEYKWWRGYTPGAADSDLRWMRDGYGYFIKLSDTLPHPINFTVYGYRTIGAPATMPSYYLTVNDTEGHDPWNLIGFTSIVEMVYTEYLDSLGDAYADDLVIYWDGVQYRRLTAGQNMEPGMGYWVLMLRDAYLTPPPPS